MCNFSDFYYAVNETAVFHRKHQSIKAKSITVFKKHFFFDVERVLTSIFTSAKTKHYCKQNFMIPYKYMYWYLWFLKPYQFLCSNFCINICLFLNRQCTHEQEHFYEFFFSWHKYIHVSFTVILSIFIMICFLD